MSVNSLDDYQTSIESRSSVHSAEAREPSGGHSHNSSQDPQSSRIAYLLSFIGILLVGFYFRFAGLNWDESQHLHPDERFLTQVLTAVEIPDSLGEYFDSKVSPLNPRNRGYGFFVYGDFPITFTRLVAEGLVSLCAPAPDAPSDGTSERPAPTPFDSLMRGLGFDTFCVRADGSLRPMTGYDEVVLVGRVLSALFDLGTLLWLFLVAREMYGTRAGLAAMALGALAVLHIQQAHFFTADSFAAHFVTAALYFVVRAGKTGSSFDFVAAGIASGLATASRINIAPVLGILAIAAFGRVIRSWGDRPNADGARIETALGQVILAAIVALFTFRISMPNAFDGLLSPDERWLGNMSTIQQQISGEFTSPPDVQWTDRRPIIFPWVNMVFWGMGLPLGLAAWVGWAVAGWRIFGRSYLARENRTIGEWLREVVSSRHLLIWVWVAAYFAWQGSQWVKSMRYLLPIYPFLTMFAGWAMVGVWDWARRPVNRVVFGGSASESASVPSASLRGSSRDASYKGLARIGAYALPVVVLTGTFLWAVAFTEIYRRPTTRVAASRWIYENIPSAATLHYADSTSSRTLQLQLPKVTTFLGPGSPHLAGFSVPASGELTGITFGRLSDSASATPPGAGLSTEAGESDLSVGGALAGRTAPNVLRVKIALDPEGAQVIAEGTLEVPSGSPAGAYSLTFDGAALEADRRYYFVGEATQGTLVASSSVLANEHWDDGIPLRLEGRDGFSFYRGIELTNYDDDTTEKLQRMIGWLGEADYIFLTSNRLYGTIPRQPLRYPLTSEFYRLLFTGQLGFELINELVSYPRLGPFEFPDQETTQALGLWPDPTRLPRPGVISVPYPPAEEAFSVYDHPRVLIFKKRPDFSQPDAITRLSGFDLEAAYHGFTPRNETGSPTGQMLTAQAWQTQQASGTWSDLFDRNSVLNANPGLGAIAWYLLVAVLGWVVFPLLYVAVPGLTDRGYGLARTLGVLLLSFLIWFAASYRVLPFTREAILVVGVTLATVGGLIARAKRLEIRDWVRRNARLILIEELVFAAAFLLFLLLRFGNPDLWHPWKGGEKPMDFAYLNAVIKSQYFPPYDPWFSGGFLTYYYYGFVTVAALTKLLGVAPAIAYNFAVPSIYALAALATFSVAHGIGSQFGKSRRRGATAPFSEMASAEISRNWGNSRNLPIVIGVLAAIFVMLIGNLGEAKLITDEVAKIGQTDLKTTIPALKTTVDFGNGLLKLARGEQAIAIPTDWWYWNPTRIIPPGEGEAGPITELPFFTFLYADLHAHMMALPITILMLGLAVSWLTHVPLSQSPATQPHSTHRFFSVLSVSLWLKAHWAELLSLVLGGLALGALRAANTADYPTYLGVGVVALAFGTWAAESLKAKETWFWFAARAGLFFASSAVLFAPFAQSDRLGGTTLEGWQGSKTELWAYLFVHGIFLFPIATYLLIELRRWGQRWAGAAWIAIGEWRWLIGAPLVVALLASLYFALTGVTALYVAVPFMLAALAMMLRPRLPVVTRFWMLMVFLALALSVAVEVVVFRGDISRMNMVFKFYYQIWVLLGITGAVALGWLWSHNFPKLNGGWLAAAITPVVVGALYPPLQFWVVLGVVGAAVLGGLWWRGLPQVNGKWRGVVILLVAAGLLYPPFAARGKLSERFTGGAPPGLDGMAYMREAVHSENDRELSLRWDYEALTWMQDNVVGTPVVAEGHSRHEYLWGGRVSIYTGLPTLFGWQNHQRQQRGSVVPGSPIDRRIQDVALLYGDSGLVTTQKILKRYGVKYIYVGELERAYYPADSLAKFERMAQAGALHVAYTNPGVTIYEVAAD